MRRQWQGGPRGERGRAVHGLLGGLPILLVWALWTAVPAAAQQGSSIAIDGTLPGTQAETLSGPDYSIPASKGVVAGPNLFHSFSRFGLETGETATFTGPGGVARILSRVTGPEVSRIDGALRSEIAGASLYLINPNGVVLGENASLDIDGAFNATTADFVGFEDGGEFHARFPGRDSPLSMTPVRSFGFLSASPAPIQVDGSQLVSGEILISSLVGSVAFGQSVSLIGGDIEILGGSSAAGPGFIFTGGERLDIASLASPGTVEIVNVDPADPDSTSDLVVEALPGTPLVLGDVRVADGAALVTGGPPPILSLANTFVNGSGDVFIRANDLTLEDAEIRTVTTTPKTGGRVDIALTGDLLADGLGLDRTTGIVSGSGLRIEVQDPVGETLNSFKTTFVFADGPAEVVTIEEQNGDLVRIEHIAQGPGGEIKVDAENVSLLGGAKLSSSGVFGGDGGSIEVDARDTVTIAGTRQDGAVGGIFSNAEAGGDSGSIDVTAKALVLDDLGGLFGEVSGVDANGDSGRGGSIDVDVERLSIQGSGRIDTTTRSAGPGGEITIDADEWVRLSGRRNDFNFSSVTTFSLAEGSGPAGTIRITSPEITLTGGAGISTSAEGLGDGGVIDLRGNVITLRDASITSAADLGAAGDIYINGGPLVPGTLEIQKPADVSPGERLVLDRGVISTSATDGFGQGGDIVIDPQFVILRESLIIARAVGGQGGNIVIVAENLLADQDTVINADSSFGTNGKVEIRSTGEELRGDVETLPSTIPEVVDLLRERCAARRSGRAAGSFVLRGRDGLPSSPDDYLPAAHRIEETPAQVAIVSVREADAPVELVLGCRLPAS